MPKSVLIIDDSLPLHKLVKTHLEPDIAAIHSTYDGETGLSAAAKLRPGLILLDVDMPGMDGFEVCRRLKKNPQTAGIPVIFLTANTAAENKIKGLELGALDYVSKPFGPGELRAAVDAALGLQSKIKTGCCCAAPMAIN